MRLWYEQEEISRQQYRREWQAYQHENRALDLTRRTDLDLALARQLLGDMDRLWRQLVPLEQKSLAQALLRVAMIDNQHVVAWHWYRPFAPLFQS